MDEPRRRGAFPYAPALNRSVPVRIAADPERKTRAEECSAPVRVFSYSTGVSSKLRISPVFSFFRMETLATLIRDWYLSFLGPDLE